MIEGMDAVIYIRWSSVEQSKGSSLERQREDCRRHAATKGWRVVDELVDDGVSAFRGRHAASGALSRFVAEVEADAYPSGVVLLTEKLDRLSREHAKKVFAWMLNMTERGVVIATVDGDRRYDSKSLDMAAIIEVVVKAQLANEESEKKASRLAAAWSAKRRRLERGETAILTRRAPAWLTVEGSPARFAVIPERAAVVRRIFEETIAGYGKNQIARNLNLDGVPTFGRADGWHASYIQKILTSTAVLGEFQPGRRPRGESRTTVGEPIIDYFPPVVSADLHAVAMRCMRGRQRGSAGRGRRLANMLAGMATCEECGAAMTFRAKGLKKRADGSVVNEDYLVCNSYQRGLNCSNHQHYNYSLWESTILAGLIYEALEDRHFASPTAIRPVETELAERVRSRESDRARAKVALNLFMETNRPEVKELWAGLTAAIDAHDEAIAELGLRLKVARGSVSPEEHRRRIYELRDQLDDKDEQVRYEARSKVREAIYELVDRITFCSRALAVKVTTNAGFSLDITWENTRGSTGCTVTSWSPPEMAELVRARELALGVLAD